MRIQYIIRNINVIDDMCLSTVCVISKTYIHRRLLLWYAIVDKFGGVKTYMKIFNCAGVGTPSPHVVQGATVCISLYT